MESINVINKHKMVSRWQRLGRNLRGEWSEWLGLLLLFLLQGIVTRSIQQAEWINPQPSFMTVLLLAFVLSYLLWKSHISRWISMPLNLLIGLIILLWQSSVTLPAPEASSLAGHFTGFLSNLWESLVGSTPNEGTIYFAVFLIVIIWFLGYYTTWRYLKNRSVWPAIFIGFAAILINLNYLNKNSYGYFYFYIFAAILLLGYVYYLKLKRNYMASHLKLPLRIMFSIMAIVMVFSGVFAGIGWVTPEIQANQLQTLTDSKINPGETLNDLKVNVFAAVHAKGTIIRNTEQSQLLFSSPPNLSEDIQFMVLTPSAPAYWRARRYDVYNSWGWSISQYEDTLIDAGKLQTETVTPADQSQLTYTVINEIKTDVILTAGQYLGVSVPSLMRTFSENTQSSSPAKDPALTPDDVMVSVSTLHIFKPDERYTVIADLDSPTPSQLAKAGLKYPIEITNRYLQLPASLPQSVKRTAVNIMRRATTPYAKVIAVRDYLSQLKYKVEGTFPPNGSDAVENFLSVQKTGNCTNFATAAAVLLRAGGVPARLCTGYLPHFVDKETGAFVIQAKDYHAWVEAYFPGYGWVEFEMTPGTASPGTPASDNIAGSAGAGSTGGAQPDLFPFWIPQPPVTSTDNQSATATLDSGSPVYIPVLISLGVLFILAITILFWMKRFRRYDYISAVWSRLYFISPIVGVVPSHLQTPLEFGARLSSVIPGQKNSIDHLVSAFMEIRFSRKKLLTEAEESTIRRSWHAVAWGIIKRRLFLIR